MRLLKLGPTEQFSLIEFIGEDIPPYAILSHTWGADHDEVSFRDIVDDTGHSKPGYRKLFFCAQQSQRDNLDFFWVDTCCIDKSSSAELSEAINCMYHWYKNAAKCYVYLSDVIEDSDPSVSPGPPDIQIALRNSSWFTRGWTLQELIAPRIVEFFSAEGNKLGDKTSLIEEIHAITKIPIPALKGDPISNYSVDERMSWAEGRRTKRSEDTVYSLLGILDIYMPLIYGEGQKRAQIRLRREIRELSSDFPDSSSQNHSATKVEIELAKPIQPVRPSPKSNSKPPLIGYFASDAAQQVVPTWPGNVISSRFTKQYVEHRNSLSNNAYSGRWNDVLTHLEFGNVEYGENWANAIRLKPAHEADRISFWTPLHQAAYLGAPVNIIKHLINHGALRSLRTRHSDLSHQDLTAGEIAQQMGYYHLTDILAPTILHPVPPKTIARLQALFHEMIRADCPEDEFLILPDINVLTELRTPEMWFPVSKRTASEYARSYQYKLQSRDLVVTKRGFRPDSRMEESPEVHVIR
jgi:hypothetical protein